MRKSALKILTSAIAITAVGFLPNGAKAQSQYFTNNIVNDGTYSWDAPSWSASGGNNSGPFTFNWTANDFARFYNGASDSYTVTVNQAESNTGLYNDASGSTLTIQDAGNGTGSLLVTGGVQGFLTAATTIIDVPITGSSGGIAPELSGSLYLNAANTYAGGTALGDSGNTLTYFNNNSAFGTGGITLNRTGIANFSTLLPYGGSALTIANNFSTVSANTGTGTGLNFAGSANTPLNVSGTWTLGTVNLNLRSSGGSTSPLTLSGAISGSGILALSANGTGNTTFLSAANPFTGTVWVTGSGGTYGGSGAITLKLGIANALANESGMVLAGGTLDPGGYNQTLGSLDLASSSSLDFEAGNSTVNFADSSSQSWTGTLNILNWSSTVDSIYFGSSSSGLTAGQLADIDFGGVAGEATLNAEGELIQVVPEPSTLVLAGLGGLSVLFLRRRKA